MMPKDSAANINVTQILQALQNVVIAINNLQQTIATATSSYALTDSSIASMSGSSQTLTAANSKRLYLLIVNTGNAILWVNLAGGTASAGGSGCVPLNPGGSIERSKSTGIYTNAIKVIGTSGQPVACLVG